jgi:hypothetical protein
MAAGIGGVADDEAGTALGAAPQTDAPGGSQTPDVAQKAGGKTPDAEEQAIFSWHSSFMPKTDFSWAIPFMRAGYAGRALVYAVIAGFGLYAIWLGGSPDGTGGALKQLETTTGGGVMLFLIFAGLLSYAVWRFIDAFWDLEDYGRDAKGMIARVGMIVTGVTHGAIGGLAFSLLFLGGDGEDGSTISKTTAQVMSWPAGLWIVGAAGVAILGAGLYYIHKGWAEKYRKHLVANEFTLNWNWVLKGGLIAHGVVVAIIGAFFVVAAWQGDPDEAGGLDRAFGWLSSQVYGQMLVTLVALGLLGFAVFCAVNVLYRVVPRAKSWRVETVADNLKRTAETAVR